MGESAGLTTSTTHRDPVAPLKSTTRTQDNRSTNSCLRAFHNKPMVAALLTGSYQAPQPPDINIEQGMDN